jgi:hypothetical protein
LIGRSYRKGFGMSAAPGISRKRGNIEVSNLMSLNFNMGLANLNRSLDSFKRRTIESDSLSIRKLMETFLQPILEEKVHS